MSFFVPLLPYHEFGKYSEILSQTSAAGVGNVVQPQPEFRVFRCADWMREVRPESPYTTAYVGLSGIGTDSAARGIREAGVGIWGYNRRTKWEDIKDGTSDTAMLLESTRANGPWYQGGASTVRGLDTTEFPYLGPGHQFGGTHYSGNWLLIRGKAVGMNVLLADGSVRFMRNGVDRAVLEALATIAGSEDTQDDW